MIRLTRSQFLAGAAASLLGTQARAQNFPTRPIRMVIGFAPGGIVDFTARSITQALGDLAGQSVVAENRTGGGGVVGTDYVAKAAPDGYTLLISDPSITVNPSLQPNLPYDLLRDIRAVAIVSSSPLVAVVPAALPINTLAELAAYGRATPGGLTYVSPGAGTMTHKSAEIFGQRAGMEATAVVYRGVGAAFPDLLAGRVHYVFSGIPGVSAMIEAGQLRPLATTGETRSASLPNVPTALEAGFPDFVFDLWTGVFAPAATPDAIVNRIASLLQESLQRPDTIAALARAGAAPRFRGPAEAQAFFRAETERWSRPA
ncbi:Bug family tripartite tricarboxylate transporter substrate binding protein [Humitalea sp. 24SJ18S-53]|uniref:Bug family tripartite tricarboxylate transporter substrate binding protein n=1 Tax=Humitalea sp. 24SJ18S-53 TaxID=3422307 RepID=UPI003D67074B